MPCFSPDPIRNGKMIDGHISCATVTPLFGEQYVHVEYVAEAGPVAFPGDHIRVNQIFIYGLDRRVTRVSNAYGLEGPATVSKVAGVTTVTFSAPLRRNFKFFLY